MKKDILILLKEFFFVKVIQGYKILIKKKKKRKNCLCTDVETTQH